MTPDRIKEIDGLIERLSDCAEQSRKLKDRVSNLADKEGFEIFARYFDQSASALRELIEERKWKPASTMAEDLNIADLWVVTTRNGNLVHQGRTADARKYHQAWRDHGGNAIEQDCIEDDDIRFVRKITHYLPLPSPPEGEWK